MIKQITLVLRIPVFLLSAYRKGFLIILQRLSRQFLHFIYFANSAKGNHILPQIGWVLRIAVFQRSEYFKSLLIVTQCSPWLFLRLIYVANFI